MRLPARLALTAGAVAGVLVLVLAAATGASRRAASEHPPLTNAEKVLDLTTENILVAAVALGCGPIRAVGKIRPDGSDVRFLGDRCLRLHLISTFDPETGHSDTSISGTNEEGAISGSAAQDVMELEHPNLVAVSSGVINTGNGRFGWTSLKDLRYDASSGSWREEHVLVSPREGPGLDGAWDESSTYRDGYAGSLNFTFQLRNPNFFSGALEGTIIPRGDGSLKLRAHIEFFTS